MIADALATMFAAVAGTSTAGAYIESATGVEAGRRTPQAYAPALIIVGLLMLAPVTSLEFDDFIHTNELPRDSAATAGSRKGVIYPPRQ